jgi:ABC-type multidrug transport system permease subunit
VVVALGGLALVAFFGVVPFVSRIPLLWRGLATGVAVNFLIGDVLRTLLTTDGSIS